jgi:hypothetical protein
MDPENKRNYSHINKTLISTNKKHHFVKEAFSLDLLISLSIKKTC